MRFDVNSVKIRNYMTNCGHKKAEDMPANACQFFYECENCKKVLKPKEGDCVFTALMELYLVRQFKRIKVVANSE